MSEIQALLHQVMLSPETFDFILKGRNIYLITDKRELIMVGFLNSDIPAVTIPLLKIKSWRLQNNQNEELSLYLNLTI